MANRLVAGMMVAAGLAALAGASETRAQAPAAGIEPLRAAVEAVIAESGAEVSVALATLDGRDRLELGADVVYHAASTMKVPVMVELFRQAAAGPFSLDQKVAVTNQFKSVVDGSTFVLAAGSDSDADLYAAVGAERSYRELCDAMITMSSNLATNVLIDRLGAHKVAETMTAYGAGGMVVRRGVEDNKAFEKGLNNTATARGYLAILMAIARREAVSAAASDEMIAILSRQAFRAGIPAGVPAGTRVAHKTGTITRIHHDGGIVFGPRPYGLVVLTRGFADEAASDRVIARISRLVWDHVQR